MYAHENSVLFQWVNQILKLGWAIVGGEPGFQKALLFAGERQAKDGLAGITSRDGCLAIPQPVRVPCNITPTMSKHETTWCRVYSHLINDDRTSTGDHTGRPYGALIRKKKGGGLIAPPFFTSNAFLNFSCDLIDFETLDLIACTDIIVIFDANTAFHAVLHFFDIIFEATQGF